jgi:hypothetical protein
MIGSCDIYNKKGLNKTKKMLQETIAGCESPVVEDRENEYIFSLCKIKCIENLNHDDFASFNVLSFLVSENGSFDELKKIIIEIVNSKRAKRFDEHFLVSFFLINQSMWVIKVGKDKTGIHFQFITSVKIMDKLMSALNDSHVLTTE